MKFQKGKRGIALNFFNPDARLGWVVKATLRPLCRRGSPQSVPELKYGGGQAGGQTRAFMMLAKYTVNLTVPHCVYGWPPPQFHLNISSPLPKNYVLSKLCFRSTSNIQILRRTVRRNISRGKHAGLVTSKKVGQQWKYTCTVAARKAT